MSEDRANHEVGVAVVTTSGRWPKSGYESENVNQKVRQALDLAAKSLKIVNTAGWIATAGGREINPDMTYRDNQITSDGVIDFGPREGGGGHA